MSYVTPVTDRTALDIASRTTKGHWNVADWVRVYGNSQLVNSLAGLIINPVQFDTLTTPTITTIPTVEEFNTFLANIERLRAAVFDETGLAAIVAPIKDDYESGPQSTSPKYTDANYWESVLDTIWEFYDGPDLEVCPTLTGDLTVTTGNQAIYVDCLDLANFNVDLQGTANLVII